MNKKLNIKLLVGLTLGLAVTAVLVHFVHEHMVTKNAEILLRRANQAEDDGDLVTAVKYRKRYMHYRRDDYEQLAELALCMKKQTESKSGVTWMDFQETYAVIEHAIRKLRDAEQLEQHQETEEVLRRASIEFAMLGGRWNDAINHLEHLISGQGDEPEIELELKLARCHTINGYNDKGIKILAKHVGFDAVTEQFTPGTATAPEAVDSYTLLAVIYRTKKLEPETAEKILAQLIQENPDSSEAYLKRCQFWRSVGDTREEQAAADIEKAMLLAPDDADVLETATELALDNDQVDKAKQILDRAIEKHSEDARFYRLLAAYAAKRKDFEQSKKYVDDGLKKVPGNIDLVWYRANLELEIGEVDDAEKSLADLKKMHAPSETLEILEAQINMAKGEWLAAAEQLSDVRADINQLRPAMVTLVDRGLARCYEMLGQPDKMLSAYQDLRQSNPEDQATVWGLIKSTLLMGNVREAADEYSRLQRDLARRGEEMDTRFRATLLELRVAEQLQRQEDQRDWSQVDTLMAEIRNDDSISEVAKVKLQVTVLKVKGDTQRANQLLGRAQELHRGDLSLRLSSVDDTYQQQGLDAALRQLDQLQQEFDAPLATRAARARLVFRHGGPGVKDGLLALENDIGQFAESDKVTLWKTLASYHYALQDFQNSRRLFERVVEIRSSDVNVRLALFDLSKELNDEAEVSATLANLEQLVGPSSAEYMASEASRTIWQVRRGLVGRESLSRARSQLSQARHVRPNWEKLDRLEAEILLMQDEPDSAVAVLQRAIKGGQSNAVIKRQLVRLLFQLGRYEEVSEVLDTLPNSERTPQEHRIARALQAGTENLSTDLAPHVNSTRPEDHNSDARALVLAKRYDEAEQALRRAVRTGPTQSETWLNLVRFLATRGQVAAAELVICQAQLYLPEFLVPVLSGQCYELIGDRERALHSYERAYHINPSDLFALQVLASYHLRGRNSRNSYERTEQTELARRYLRELITAAPQTDAAAQPQAAWARREQARLTAQSGRYRDYLEALRLIEENAGPDGNLGPDDLVLWASLSGARADANSRSQAIQKLEAAEKQRSLTKAEKLILVELYEKTKQKWDRCRTLVESVIESSPNDLSVAAIWADWLLERDATAEVEKLLDKFDPEMRATKMLRARLLVRQGRTNEANPILRELMPNASTDEKQRPAVLLEVAKLTEQLAEIEERLYDPAGKLYRSVAASEPAAKLILAAYLGRRGGTENLDEAFALCEQALKDQSVDAVIQTAMTALREQKDITPSDAKYWSQLQKWMEMAQQSSPDSTLLILRRAAFEEARGNTPVAEALYRKLLARPGLDAFNVAVASNNLAYLLALQGNGNEAMTLVRTTIEELGPIDDVMDTRAVVFLTLGQLKNAREDLRQIISGGSKSPESFFHLAQAEHALGESADARKSLERAIELGLTVNRIKPIERQSLLRLAQELGVDLSAVGGSDGRLTRAF